MLLGIDQNTEDLSASDDGQTVHSLLWCQQTLVKSYLIPTFLLLTFFSLNGILSIFHSEQLLCLGIAKARQDRAW